MRWRAATVAMAILNATCMFGQQPLVRIELKEQAVVASPTIRLCDVAEVTALTADSEKLVAPLRELTIAPSPLPRYRRIITAGEVATKLAQAGWKNGDFVLDGAKQVLVTRTGRNLTATELETALQKALNAPVKLLLPPPNIVVPEGELTVQTEKPTSSRTVLPVTLLVNGQPIATLKLLAQLSALTNTDAPSLDNSSPSRLAHLPTCPSAQILVRRRQTVRLRAQANSVVVTAQGMALQDGKLGDEVMVAVPWSKTPLKGVVTGEKEVTVSAW